jgi:hypothetical protein
MNEWKLGAIVMWFVVICGIAFYLGFHKLKVPVFPVAVILLVVDFVFSLIWPITLPLALFAALGGIIRCIRERKKK